MTKDTTTDDYRACFMTDPGRRVLGHILLDAGFFDTDLTTPEEVAVRNFAINILRNCGVDPLKHTGKIVETLFSLGV